jgi:carbamoyltransferase
MMILGLYPVEPTPHDANVCLLQDGNVLFASEEERLARNQHYYTAPGDPMRSLLAALRQTCITPDRIDLWAFVGSPRSGDFEHAVTDFFRRTTLGSHGMGNVRCVRIRHHEAHVATAVLTSPFDRCLYFSLDGGGDDGYAKIGVFDGSTFQDLHRAEDLHLANFYSCMTHVIGFHEFEEGKTMGLASYGACDPALYRKLRQVIRLDADGMTLRFNREMLQAERLLRLDKYDWNNVRRQKVCCTRYSFPSVSEIRYMNRADIAATVQQLAEDIVLELVANAVARTGIRQICLSGGLFQNVKINKKVRELPEVEAVHIPMAVGDAGLGLGAALAAYWKATGRRCSETPLSPYLLHEFTAQEIESAIGDYGLRYTRTSEPATLAARHIAEGKVVGWFQGRGEYGPRALGSRSVLADPRDPDSKARVNQLLKKRDWFMPYAPSILDEFKDEYLEEASESPYMAMAYDVRPERRRFIPAAVHVDGTCRPQTVRRDWSPRFHELITEFHRLTGVPVVLNTSFNRHGQAMVTTPQHALDHLVLNAVDVLMIGDFEVRREFLHRDTGPGDLVSEATKVLELRIEPAIRALRDGRDDRAVDVLAEELRIPPSGARRIAEAIRSLQIDDGDLLGVIVRLVGEFQEKTPSEDRTHGTQEGEAARPF